MKYSFDTSVLIQGWHDLYPPRVFPALWQKIEALVDDGTVVASEEVLIELERKDDEIHEWARQHKHMFLPIEEDTQDIVRRVLKDYQRLLDTRKGRSGADPFVIALAISHKLVVVTQEPKTGKPDTKPNIPDVCDALGVPCMSLLKMIQNEAWVF